MDFEAFRAFAKQALTLKGAVTPEVQLKICLKLYEETYSKPEPTWIKRNDIAKYLYDKDNSDFRHAVKRTIARIIKRLDEYYQYHPEKPCIRILDDRESSIVLRGKDRKLIRSYRLVIEEPEYPGISVEGLRSSQTNDPDPELYRRKHVAKHESLARFKELAARFRSPKIENDLPAIDGLIILWMCNDPSGLEATALKLHNVGSKDLNPQTGLPEKYTEHIVGRHNEIKDIVGENRPKVWVSDYKIPFSDRPFLTLTIGKTDYVTFQCLEKAFDSRDGIRQKYENKSYDIFNDLPNIVAIHSIILTEDQRLILAQRKPKQVDAAGGEWSASFEEQWDAELDNTPYDTIIRGLREEFNIDADHGVPVSIKNIQLFALGREWGDYWDIAMIYLVRLPVNAEKILECWTSLPPPQDVNENIAVAAVPTSEIAGIQFLLNLLNREAKVFSSDLMHVCGPNMVEGLPSPDEKSYPPHQSTGRARIFFALWATGKF